MCGRYSLFAPREDVEERFGARFVDGYDPTYNAAPSQSLPVVTNEAPDEIRHLRWGLIPAWADDETDGGHINARAETIREKPSFREAYERRRCLVPADGFYEWVETDDGKRPYRVALEDDRPFAMAGIWERWERPVRQTSLDAFGGSEDGPEVVESFAIVTTDSNAVVADLHHRMAVVLPPAAESRWLAGEDTDDLLVPYPGDDMHAYPVSTAVNSPANDDPSLVEPVEG